MSVSKPRRKERDPFQLGVQKPMYCKLLYPSSVGAITAASLALTPTVLGREVALINYLPRSVARLPTPLILALIGFPLGYLATKTANWVRWMAIRRLLQYQGWVHGSKALKTQVWALLLKLLKGPGPAGTYDFQRSLPKLPLPGLDETLNRWLEVSAQLVSKEEFEHTKDAVEMFRKNEGPTLQRHLQKRYMKEVNWLSEYWMNAAYLSCRDPLSITSNFFLVNRTPVKDLSMLDRAGGCVRRIMEFYEMATENTLPPVELQELVPLCMNGYRYIFNTVRIPCENMDRIQRYPGETHIVVIRNGHYYRMEMYTSGLIGKRRLLTAHELKLQFAGICDHADAQQKQLPVASLTSQNRTVWAKQRGKLAENNGDTLKCVESALFIVYLDQQPSQGQHEHCGLTLSGRGDDRWHDKSFTSHFFKQGEYGINVEHSGVDAMVITTMAEYCMVTEKYETYGLPAGPPPDGNLPPALQLPWDLANMEAEIETANEEYLKMANNLNAYMLNTKYGKGFMKKARISPDGYIQMVLQLAYYKLHKETPKTYEPSTSRLYALGRTENIHPMGAQSRAWVQAMLDPSSTNQTRADLLRRAVNRQSQARLQATLGQGCDRHLVGLYCASRELDMDIPAIYLDKAWQLPFTLSTSQTPTRTVEMGADMDYKWVIGGFGPQCADGYGISYVFMGEDLLNIIITSWHSSAEADAAKFASVVDEAMGDVRELLS